MCYVHGDFTPKDTDDGLTLTDGDGNQVPVTLNATLKESIVSAIGMAPGKQYVCMMDTGPVVIFRRVCYYSGLTSKSRFYHWRFGVKEPRMEMDRESPADKAYT